MFNFKKATKKIAQQVAAAFDIPQDPNEVIAEIHNEFDSATERLLKEAKEILATSKDTSKGERLSELGFKSSKPVVESSAEIQKRRASETLAENIEYFSTNYPFNKYITLNEVSKICNKYGLVFGDAYYYTGDVPEKNIRDIENFKLKEEDFEKLPVYEYNDQNGRKVRYIHAYSEYYGRYSQEYVSNENITEVKRKLPMKICAPISDFDTRNMKIEDGYKLQQNIPDPIVLQPVKGGFLIITKWGDEASDEMVVNQVNN